MKILLLIGVMLLAGCAAKPVPVKQKFPASPTTLMQPCPDLKLLPKDVKLSDVAKTINENYSLYHECSIKSQGWIDWYNAQKKIFEEVK